MNELLKKRETLFQGILTISHQQLEFCQQENLEPEGLTKLLELISQRQSLMDEIDRLDLTPVSDPPSAGSSGTIADGVTSAHHSTHNEKVLELIEAVSRNDEACLRLLKKKSGELAARIKQTRVNRQAADAYGQGNSIYDAWFVDKKK